MARITREKFKTMHNVFDEFTNRNIYKLITQGHIAGLGSPISIGKEANIFSAQAKDGHTVMVKIYRLEAADFKKMYEYIRDDPRYINLKGKRRKIILAWVQREFRNLLLAREHKVRVPKPIAIIHNCIVMEYIGDHEIAPKIKDKIPKHPKAFLKKTIEEVKKLYAAGLVHADLSSFNILNYNENPVILDFSQCTPKNSPRAEEYLKRDMRNIANFFKKLGITTSEEKLLKEVKAVKKK